MLAACGSKNEQPITPPWGEVSDSVDAVGDFDLDDIQGSGEMILLTLTGPEYYYDYRGRQLGTQYLLAQKFAATLGVRLRVEVCRDSVEMVQRLNNGDGDIMAATQVGRLVASPKKDDLAHELQSWYSPTLLDEVRREEAQLLSSNSVKRHVYSPMLDRKGGIISHYDQFFIQYSRPIRWDWRLMAAQCYQESTFDPKAKSWAGACGLMQIMPATADLLGLPRDKMFDAEHNIRAAAKYLAQLENSLLDIRDRRERTNFILASYNGGTTTFAMRWHSVSVTIAILTNGLTSGNTCSSSPSLATTTTPSSSMAICEAPRLPTTWIRYSSGGSHTEV